MTTTSNRHGSATVSLPSDTEILITRAFDAPASLVFKAFTTPELVKRWWGFDSSQWLVCDIDLRVGRHVAVRHQEGDMEVGFHGEYREIDDPHRLVSTEVFEGVPRCRLRQHDDARRGRRRDDDDDAGQARHQEHRDGHLQSGMEGGMQISYNRLEDVVAAPDGIRARIVSTPRRSPPGSRGTRRRRPTCRRSPWWWADWRHARRAQPHDRRGPRRRSVGHVVRRTVRSRRARAARALLAGRHRQRCRPRLRLRRRRPRDRPPALRLPGLRGRVRRHLRRRRRAPASTTGPTRCSTVRVRSTTTTAAAGVYFPSPDGHFLEIITRPYGSGG